MKFRITGDNVSGKMLAYVDQMRMSGRVPEIEVLEYDPHRSLDQNALINSLYPEIARQKSDETALDVRRRLKLTRGVPILRAENEAFRRFYNSGLLALTYEQKIEAMDFVPVTSIMTKKQGTQFIENVLAECSEQGINIQLPYKE
jgi:hypothetical protein